MLKNENIICISSIDWDFIWQGHQEIMSAFARNGNRVLFIENTGVRSPTIRDLSRLRKRLIRWFGSIKGFRQEEESIFIYSPVILPFPYSRIARWINRRLLIRPLKRWMRAAEFHQPIIWTFLPTGTALDIISGIEKKLLVYYCIADFNELTDSPGRLKKTEEDLLRICDIVFAQGKVLEDKCRKFNSNVHVFPFGVNTRAFEDFISSSHSAVPEDAKKIKKPIIGYIGGIHKHIDFKLIDFIAGSHPEWSIILIGPIQTDVSVIQTHPNIYFLGKKNFFELPAYINIFDVCVIPYLKSEYTRTVYPTKLNEYHMLGKPVVSTSMPEVEAFNKENGGLVFVAEDHEEFVCKIEGLIKSNDNSLVKSRIESAKLHSWDERIRRMNGLMEESLIRKDNHQALDWQDRMLLLYKSTKKKVIKAVGAFLVLWLLIFYTPALWFIAEPLKISEPPEIADVILVLAGGVGESGKAGQGYEERVQYAVELYKKGLAGHIILSSGYKYVFEETSIMKALTVYLGVPEEAIILEDKAINVYENIRFAKDILIANGWRKVLLVSSPYNMLRVRLVTMKNIPRVKVFYTPIPRSNFYEHSFKLFSKQVTVEQIRAIMHEYLGILYYKFKGFI